MSWLRTKETPLGEGRSELAFLPLAGRQIALVEQLIGPAGLNITRFTTVLAHHQFDGAAGERDRRSFRTLATNRGRMALILCI
jgi:hypothetical protein